MSVCDVGLRPSDDVMIEDLVDSRQPYQRFLAWKKLSDKEHKFALRTAEKKRYPTRQCNLRHDNARPEQSKSDQHICRAGTRVLLSQCFSSLTKTLVKLI